MKDYPSIPKIILGDKIYAFDKLDGSQLRGEWTRKRGFMKYGSRKRLLGEDERPLGLGIPLFKEKYAEPLDKHFRRKGYEKVTVYFELHSPTSFAGYHGEEAEFDQVEFDVTLFDVFIDRKGFVPPKEFIKEYEQFGIPAVLYHGNANQEFVESVQSGTLEGMTFEGVVCKGGYDKHGNVSMFKVKNRAWLQKLRDRCVNEAEFERLA